MSRWTWNELGSSDNRWVKTWNQSHVKSINTPPCVVFYLAVNPPCLSSSVNWDDANFGGCSFRGYMKYQKPWLSYEEQANRLKERGLVFDRDYLIDHLAEIGYYRLSGYWYIYKDPDNENESFIEGASFDKVWDLYTFDRQLRLITLDAIERVEVYMRTQLAYRLAEQTGPFGYLDRATLPNMDQKTYGHFMSRCFDAYNRSKTLFIEHFKEKYGDSHGLPPYWTLVNIMDFGMMLTLFRGSPDDVKKGIADEIGVPLEVFDSWLLMLNTVRNACAHHDRLWNKRLGNRPKIPRGHRYPEWHRPHEVNNSTTFTLLSILGYLIERIAPNSSWREKMIHLIRTRSEEDLRRMGFSEGWEECPLWKPYLSTPESTV